MYINVVGDSLLPNPLGERAHCPDGWALLRLNSGRDHQYVQSWNRKSLRAGNPQPCFTFVVYIIINRRRVNKYYTDSVLGNRKQRHEIVFLFLPLC